MLKQSAAQNGGIIEPLTTREMDILRLIVTGLSNREIGIQLFLSEGTIKWHNKHIFDKLDVRSRAEAIVKAQSLRLFHQPIVLVPDKPRSNLPAQPTAFIGRDNEIQEVIGRIRHPDCRLLTLIGAGGSGKTRLAIQAAVELLPHFRDGVFFTPIEPITSPDQVIPAIAQACRLHFNEDVDPRQQLFDFLHQKELLLVLDNFEHLLEAKSDVVALLEQARHLRIVITTRVPLHVPEEWILTVTGMAFPAQASLQDREEFDAVRLFLACARRSGRTLSLPNDLKPIAHICQLTHGMPLAIELAASWLRTLTCQEIAAELRANTDLLTTPLHDLPERHQSMRRVFEHSWNLVAENDRKTLRALSIFRGGFTSAALRSITGASLTDLARLIDHSFVQVTGSGRYDLHPLIAQYLQEHLLASGEHPIVSAAHAAYFAEFLRVRRRDLMGGRQLAALGEIQPEFENISAAWVWLIDQQDYANIEIAWEGLLLYIDVRGGWHLFGHLRKLPLATEKPHRALAYLHCILPDYSEEEIQRALAIADQHQDLRARAFALRALGHIFGGRHEYTISLSWYVQSLALFRQLGDDFYVGWILQNMGFSYLAVGDRAKRDEVSQESLRVFRSINNQEGMAEMLHDIASNWYFDGEYALAEPFLREAYTIIQEFRGGGVLLFCTQFMGHLPFLAGDFAAAAQFYHAALEIAEDIGGFWSQVFALLLGYLANAEGDYLEADAQFSKSRDVFGFHPFGMMMLNWGHALANCGLRRYPKAQEYLYASLKTAFTIDSIAYMTLNLPAAALILWNDGKKDLAVEMMALAFTHPKSEQRWFVKSPLGEHALEDMKSEMGEREFDAAWQRGTQRDLHETSSEILAMFAKED